MGFLVIYIPALVLGALLGRSAGRAAVVGGVTQAAIIAFLAYAGAYSEVDLNKNELIVGVILWIAIAALVGAVGFTIKKIIKALLNNPSEFGATVAGGLTALFFVALQVALLGFYLSAIWTDAKRGNTAYFIADLVIPPFAVIRGALIWLGFV